MTRAVDIEGRGVQVNGRSVGGGTDIPDSVVSRDPDNNSPVRQYKTGVRIETSQDWPEIQAEVSANSDNATKAYLQETDGTVIDTVSTNLTAGDVVTFDNANLSANTKYNFVIDDEGAGSYTHGEYTSTANHPYTSSDGNLSIIDNALDQQSTSAADALFNLYRIGNVGF